jgi:hypothetical protein
MSILTDITNAFRPAQSVSYRWYNAVASALREMYPFTEGFKRIPGYDDTKRQALMHYRGVVRWKTTTECTTT